MLDRLFRLVEWLLVSQIAAKWLETAVVIVSAVLLGWVFWQLAHFTARNMGLY